MIVAAAYDSGWCNRVLVNETSALRLGQSRLIDVCGPCRTDMGLACQALIEAGFVNIFQGEITVPFELAQSRWIRRHLVNCSHFEHKPPELMKKCGKTV